MEQRCSAECLECGTISAIQESGGFLCHLVRCEECGNTKAIEFIHLGDLFLCYLRGLPGPYSAASKLDGEFQEYADLEPISEDEYHRGVETFAGNCECGGRFTLNAPLRCPECHSTRIRKND